MTLRYILAALLVVVLLLANIYFYLTFWGRR